MKITVLKCLSCRYQWQPIVPAPRKCPNCQRPLTKDGDLDPAKVLQSAATSL